MRPPFEPLTMCCLLHLLLQGSFFLIAITSARRVAELHALTSEPPYTFSLKEIVSLHSHPRFLSKVVSNVHVCQSIYLCMFYLKLHANREEQHLCTLDVRRSLAFYIGKTKQFILSTKLFMAIVDRMKALPISSQGISYRRLFMI